MCYREALRRRRPAFASGYNTFGNAIHDAASSRSKVQTERLISRASMNLLAPANRRRYSAPAT